MVPAILLFGSDDELALAGDHSFFVLVVMVRVCLSIRDFHITRALRFHSCETFWLKCHFLASLVEMIVDVPVSPVVEYGIVVSSGEQLVNDPVPHVDARVIEFEAFCLPAALDCFYSTSYRT